MYYTPRANILQNWSERLKAMSLHEFAAALLEATAPFNLIGAQLLYVSQPILNSWVPDAQLETFAALLENPETTNFFIQSLREANR